MGFRLVSVNGENVGSDPTKMKISPENAKDLETLNFDDIAAGLTAGGAKTKSMFKDLAKGLEAIPDIINNIKDINSAVQDLDPNSTYQTNKKAIDLTPVDTQCTGGCEDKYHGDFRGIKRNRFGDSIGEVKENPNYINK